jgi:hypothetical protein
MQLPPITFDNVSLLLAIDALMLLIIEVFSTYYGATNLVIKRSKLRNAALVVTVLFFVTIAIKIMGILTSS